MFRFLKFIFRGKKLSEVDYRMAKLTDVSCQDYDEVVRWYRRNGPIGYHCIEHNYEETHKDGTCDNAEEKPKNKTKTTGNNLEYLFKILKKAESDL